MADFISDGQPFETPEGAAEESYAATPPSFPRAVGAFYGTNSVLEPLTRFVERSEYEPGGMFGRALAVAGENAGGVPISPDVQAQLPGMTATPSPTLSADEVNAKYAPLGPDGKPVKITDAPMPEGVAQLVGKAKADEIERDGVIARFENTHSWPVNLAVGAAATLLDPINAASAFIPGIGEEAVTARLGGGFFARLAGRAVSGATGGAAAQAPLTAVRLALSSQEGDDYSMRDAFRDMAFGAAGGAVLQAGIGTLGELARSGRGMARTAPETGAGEPPTAAPPTAGRERPAAPMPVPGEVADILNAPATTTHGAMSAAVSQIVEGRPVDVTPIIPPRVAAPPVERAPIDVNPIREDRAVLPSGREIPVRYGIAEAGDLEASQRADFSPNPNYPAELQPRDRTRSASALQVGEIARNLNPRLLEGDASAAGGAPIVGPDGVVESGNGRVMAIAQAYREGLPSGDAYRQHLAVQGYPVEGVKNPVLVRVRAQPMSFDERAAFAREANQRTTLGMGAAEQARSDASALSDDVLALHRGGDVGSAGNRDFVRAFVRDVPGPTERAGMLTADGGLSVAGRHRIEGALLAKAYDDPGIIAAITEDPDSNIKGIGRALTEVSPAWAAMRREARAGQLNPAVDVTRDLLDAVNLVRQARTAGRNVAEFVKQRDIFGGAISPEAEAFLRIMYRGEDFAQPRSAERVADALAKYAAEARKTKSAPGLFGTADLTSPQEILGNALRYAEGRSTGTADLFAQQSRGAQPLGGRAAGRGGQGPGPLGGAGGAEAPGPARPAPRSLADVAHAQRSLYAGDFAPGIPAPEMQRTAEAIYGERPSEPHVGAVTRSVAAADQKLAEAQAMFEATGAQAHPQDAAEIDRTAHVLDQAQRARDALGEAGACMGGSE